ncbi:bestrophin-like domain [Labrys monachus]|uniref:Membrane protein n=1 Tax=Labrys monachus TaxID=217067 RepID=A0ABU0FB62_9HYPH|nr:hypothetical protein [Labrys monachus]MDQ0391858.1 putative membrane protein [Labrys monachus]
MDDFITSSVVGVCFAAIAILIVLGSYFLARRVLPMGLDGDRTHDAAASVAGRIAALYGLILALVYAQELEDYKGIRSNLTEEAVAIADVYNDIARYGGAAVKPVQAELARYLSIVVNEEWGRLGRREGLSPGAWNEWNAVYEQLLDLAPTTDRQRYLAARMRDRITAVARFRQIRGATARSGFSGLFWGPALIGLVLLAVPFYVYRPSRSHLLLLGIFGLYSGIILFFIYAFANPFVPPGELAPRPFSTLLEGPIGESLPPGQ